MKSRSERAFPSDVIRLQKNQKLPYIYDVELQGIEELIGYGSLECHIVLYPYCRKITSAHITFFPFEEYVQDVLSHHRSAYARIGSGFAQVFGLLLGCLIALVFLLCKPEELFSVESVVSVFAAYAIGKELWDDIENALIQMSEGWRIRYRERYYEYQLEKKTTLTLYSRLARRHRYGKASLAPTKMDFIKQSNSQTVRMYFEADDLRLFGEPSAHILSVHVEPSLLQDFEQEGFMFGVKLSFNRGCFGVTRCFELFQSLDGESQGCLDETGNWVDGGIFYRHTWVLGRIKYFGDKGIMHDRKIIAC